MECTVMTYTPGPWTLTPDLIVVDKRGAEVVDIHIASQLLEASANGRLIAAAPDMLAALETIRKLVEPGQEMHLRQAIDAMSDCYQAARAAIAKATGGES
jgi:hypothetical protein